MAKKKVTEYTYENISLNEFLEAQDKMLKQKTTDEIYIEEIKYSFSEQIMKVTQIENN